MGKSYRPYLPDQEFLLPPSLRDWLPENHLVYFVSDVIDNLNLSALDAVYGAEQRGQPPYDPRMMTKLLVYGYCVGVYSSRRIQQRLESAWESTGSACCAPDHNSFPDSWWYPTHESAGEILKCCKSGTAGPIPLEP